MLGGGLVTRHRWHSATLQAKGFAALIPVDGKCHVCTAMLHGVSEVHVLGDLGGFVTQYQGYLLGGVALFTEEVCTAVAHRVGVTARVILWKSSAKTDAFENGGELGPRHLPVVC